MNSSILSLIYLNYILRCSKFPKLQNVLFYYIMHYNSGKIESAINLLLVSITCL